MTGSSTFYVDAKFLAKGPVSKLVSRYNYLLGMHFNLLMNYKANTSNTAQGSKFMVCSSIKVS